MTEKKERISIFDKLNPFRTKTQEEKRALEKEMKVLLLGSSSSGKTTIAKQMRVIHSSGFPEHERKNFKQIVYSNVITAINILITAARNMDFQLLPSNKEAASRVQELAQQFFKFTVQDFAYITSLWADPAIQQAFLRSHELGLYDYAPYFLNHLGRLSSPGYLPTQQDIINIQAKTVGIIETYYEVDGIKYKMADLGGTHWEKWLHCFQDFTVILFVAALNDFTMKLNEDGYTRMHDSLKLFGQVCNSELLREATIILLLNKRDLFKDLISKVNLNVCFDDYCGPGSYEDGLKYISNKFLAVNCNHNKKIYVQVVSAVDADSASTIFNTIKKELYYKYL